MRALRVEFLDGTHEEFHVIDGFVLPGGYNGCVGPLYDIDNVGHLYNTRALKSISVQPAPTEPLEQRIKAALS